MIRRILAFLISFCFIFEQTGFAQLAIPMGIPAYLSSFAPVSDKFRPIHLRSIGLDPNNGNFELILDKGDLKDVLPRQLEETTQELYRYFQVGLALPNKYFWVNLRPDSPDDVIEPLLEKTDVGRIMLAADLQLKKDLAGATSPQTPEGKLYWDKLYAKASELYGQQDIGIPTLTRPWIVPGEIIIRSSETNAFVYKATLKVMLEQDYLKDASAYNFNDPRLKELNSYSSQLIRELIIPKLTREVNSSKRYAQLRQVYYSLILAQWFKSRSQSHKVTKSQVDSKDLNGLTSKSSWSKDTYYQAYRKSFQQGEYNRQEQVSSVSGPAIRQYTSGGIVMGEQKILEIPASVRDFFVDNEQFPKLSINPGVGVIPNLPAGVDFPPVMKDAITVTDRADGLIVQEGRYLVIAEGKTRYLKTYDLNSCVCLTFRDPHSGAVGLMHLAWYQDVEGSVKAILNDLTAAGVTSPVDLEVKLIGPGNGQRDKEGWRLVRSIRESLEKNGVRQWNEDLEGADKRNILFDGATGTHWDMSDISLRDYNYATKISFEEQLSLHGRPAPPQEIRPQQFVSTDGGEISYVPEEIVGYARSKSKEILETFFSFEDFMNEALFNPDWGYYSSGKVQIKQDLFDEGHFRTFPESMSPYFGELVGKQVFNLWKQMKETGRIKPKDKFQVLEFGAGNGTLAYDMLSFLTRQPEIYPQDADWKEFVSQLQYVIGERSDYLREGKQRPRLAVFGDKVEILPADARSPQEFTKSGFKGVIVSNELPDAFGVQRVRFDQRFLKDGFFEVCVAVPALSRETLLQLGLGQEKTEGLKMASSQYSESYGLPAETGAVYLSAETFTELVSLLEHSQDKELRERFEQGLRFKEIFVAGELVPKVQDYINKNREMISGRLKNNPQPFIIPINPAAAEYIRSVSKILNAEGSAGYVLTIDYGGNSHEIIQESAEDVSLRTYSDNEHKGKDYYVYAGYKDLTADVDATYLHLAGEEAGLTTVVFGHQGMLFDYRDALGYQLMKQRQPLKVKKFLGRSEFFLLLQASRNIPAGERYKYPYYVNEWGKPRGAALDPQEMLFVRSDSAVMKNQAFLDRLKEVGVNDPSAFVEQTLSIWEENNYELTRMLFSYYWDKPQLPGEIIRALDEFGLLQKGMEDPSRKADGGRKFVFPVSELNTYIQSEMSVPAIEGLKKTYENLYGLAVSVKRGARVPIASVVPSSQDKITLKELAARILQLSNGTGNNIAIWKDTDKNGIIRNFIMDGHHRFAALDVLNRRKGGQSGSSLISSDVLVPSEEGRTSFSRQALRPISEINVVLPDESIVKIKDISLKDLDPRQSVIFEVSGNTQRDGGSEVNREDQGFAAAAILDPEIREFIVTAMRNIYQRFGVKDETVRGIVDIISSSYPAGQVAIAERLSAYIKTTDFLAVFQNYESSKSLPNKMELVKGSIAGPVVVDIGCGTGSLSAAIAREIPGVEKVIATDVKDYRTIIDDSVEFRFQPDPQTIPVASNTADTVVLSFVLHHVEKNDLGRFLGEIKRILKNDGKVVIIEDTYSNTGRSEYNSDYLKLFLKLDEQQKIKALAFNDWLGNTVFRGMAIGLPYNFRSMEEWEKVFRAAGLSLAAQQSLGIRENSMHFAPVGVFVLNKIFKTQDGTMPIAPQRDGGTLGKDLGGIDFRALPVISGQPTIAPVLMPQLQKLAANSRIKDLDQEWAQIRGEMLAPEMPYNRIKEYIAVCLIRPDCRKKLDQAVSCIIDILRMEEDQALATNQELKDILKYLS